MYESIAHPENLRIAFLRAAREKQHKLEVIRFRLALEENIRDLAAQLISENVDIGDYAYFTVKDPKHRSICAAPFRERILHHAIMNICEPILEPYAIHDSYACRMNKGLRRAVRRCQFFSRQYDWFLKLDIHKYFDTIDHDIMLRLLAKRIKDGKLLGLFDKLLATYHVQHGKGVPIGNLISQHLANFYLGSFDHWLKEEKRVKGYLRYMDDFVIFTRDKNTLRKVHMEVSQFIFDNLRLHIKSDWVLNRCNQGIPFLGFRITPSVIRLGRRSKRRFVEKLKMYEHHYVTGRWDENDLSNHIAPLIEFTRNADAFSFRQNTLYRHGVEF